MFRSVLFTAAAAVLATACMTRDSLDRQLAHRAAFDLDCPESELTITDLDASNSGVEGCGKHATYVGICQHFQCTWIQQGATAER